MKVYTLSVRARRMLPNGETVSTPWGSVKFWSGRKARRSYDELNRYLASLIRAGVFQDGWQVDVELRET